MIRGALEWVGEGVVLFLGEMLDIFRGLPLEVYFLIAAFCALTVVLGS